MFQMISQPSWETECLYTSLQQDLNTGVNRARAIRTRMRPSSDTPARRTMEKRSITSVFQWKEVLNDDSSFLSLWMSSSPLGGESARGASRTISESLSDLLSTHCASRWAKPDQSILQTFIEEQKGQNCKMFRDAQWDKNDS